MHLALVGKFRLKDINNALVLEIPNANGSTCSSDKPVTVGGEDKVVDFIIGIKRVQVLVLIQIPQDHLTILASRSTKRAIRGNSNGVDIAIVANEVGTQLELAKVPNLSYNNKDPLAKHAIQRYTLLMLLRICLFQPCGIVVRINPTLQGF